MQTFPHTLDNKQGVCIQTQKSNRDKIQQAIIHLNFHHVLYHGMCLHFHRYTHKTLVHGHMDEKVLICMHF